LKWPSAKSTPIEIPGTETAKYRESIRKSRKHRNGVLTPGTHKMNEFTDKNEQAFLDACGAIGVELSASVERAIPCFGVLKNSSVVAGN
jgi:hypothetical protein